MPKRRWNERFAYFITGWPKKYLQEITWWTVARFIASACLSLLLILMTIVWISGWWDSLLVSRLDRFERYRQEEGRANNAQQQAARRIGEECAFPLAPVHIVTECLSAEIQSYEKQRDTGQDAQAQLDMALWAEWTFKATAVGLAFSFLGLFVLLWSLWQTRTAISNDREVGHKQVRAYIGFNLSPPTKILPGLIPSATFKIVNTGNSPAKKMRYMSFLEIYEHPLLDWQGTIVGEDPAQKIPSMTVRANGDIDAETFYFDKSVLSQETFESVAGESSRRMYLVCKVIYDDVFDKEHFSELTAYLDIVGFRKIADNSFVGKLEWVLSHVRNDSN